MVVSSIGDLETLLAEPGAAGCTGSSTRNVVPAPGALMTSMRPPACVDDAVHGLETDAGAAARRLGGEERFEDARLDVLAHADTGVGDADDDELGERKRRGAIALARAATRSTS